MRGMLDNIVYITTNYNGSEIGNIGWLVASYRQSNSFIIKCRLFNILYQFLKALWIYLILFNTRCFFSIWFIYNLLKYM